MELSIIKIGNSKGLRLPKALLDKYHLQDKVEVILEEEQIILKPAYQPRKGWEEAFARMHDNGDDELFMDDVFEDENFEELEN